MDNKVNSQKGFIQIIIPIVIILAGFGVSYGVIYNKSSSLVKEANKLEKEEKYNEALSKLSLAQASWPIEKLAINKQKIIEEVDKNKNLLKDKLEYNQGLDEFSKGNLQNSIDILSGLSENSFYYQKSQTKIEETKRKIVEGELSEEKVARKEAEQKTKQEELAKIVAQEEARQEESAKIVAQEETRQEAAKRALEEIARKTAEEKAKQEETAKKAREQELAENKIKEEELNADKDRDGLTNREEIVFGTSDLDPDSDRDGIMDSLDSNPAGGGRDIAQYFSFNYDIHSYTWTPAIHSDWYDYYKNLPRQPQGVAYVTYNDPYIKGIAGKLLNAINEKGYSKADFVISFIHNLPYMKDAAMGYNDYPKYPIETFVEKNGDCEDTSYLTAAILEAMNLDVVLMILPGHMAVGVWADANNPGTYYELDGRRYYYLETTGEESHLGEIPNEYRDMPATLIKIPSGETFEVNPGYKKPCNPSSDFSGYYSDGENFYSDSQCNNLVYCLPYKEFYYNYQEKSFYHDSGCTQIAVPGCSKSIYYPGYFFSSYDLKIYVNSQCTQLKK